MIPRLDARRVPRPEWIPTVCVSRARLIVLTDARARRAISGAPVVMRVAEPAPALGDLPWMLLGVQPARLDVGSRDQELDGAFGLNCDRYADILLTFSEN